MRKSAGELDNGVGRKGAHSPAKEISVVARTGAGYLVLTRDSSAGFKSAVVVILCEGSTFEVDQTTFKLRHFVSILFLVAVGGLTAQSICQIQGSGAASDYDGQTVTTEGVVTALFTGTGSVNGYFIEQPACDASPATSNGIFVYDPTPGGIMIGQRVSVTGVVDEFNGTTEITNASYMLLGVGAVQPTAFTLPIGSAWDWENYEGMLLRFPGQLTVTGNENWVRYGELYLSPLRLMVPTDHVDPNDASASSTTSTGASNAAAVSAAALANDRSRILLDDGRTNSYPTPTPWADTDGTMRAGSTTDDLQGVLHYAYGAYRLEPVGAVQFQHAPRPVVPEVGGSLKAASINVLNYFTTLGDWGAGNADELNRQRTKLVAALQELNADVVALCELENTDDAWSDLLDALNAATGAGTYEGVEEDGFGNGTRTVIFYKPGTLTPVTQLFWLNTGIFQRPHLTQGFEVNGTGDRFLFSTMHLRSKLCENAEGADLDQGDGQGCFNGNRRAQANALVQHWSGLRSTTGIAAQLIMGDFNAYSEEDPLDVLRAAGLVSLLGPGEYSYCYQGAYGALDHAFCTEAMEGLVTGTRVWHINSDEPEGFDYADENIARYQPNAFRCSDHDPVLVGFGSGPVGLLENDVAVAVQVTRNQYSVTWSTPATATFSVELFDARGTLLQRIAPVSGSLTADLTGISSGLLLWRTVSLDRDGGMASGRLILP